MQETPLTRWWLISAWKSVAQKENTRLLLLLFSQICLRQYLLPDAWTDFVWNLKYGQIKRFLHCHQKDHRSKGSMCGQFKKRNSLYLWFRRRRKFIDIKGREKAQEKERDVEWTERLQKEEKQERIKRWRSWEKLEK